MCLAKRRWLAKHHLKSKHEATANLTLVGPTQQGCKHEHDRNARNLCPRTMPQAAQEASNCWSKESAPRQHTHPIRATSKIWHAVGTTSGDGACPHLPFAYLACTNVFHDTNGTKSSGNPSPGLGTYCQMPCSTAQALFNAHVNAHFEMQKHESAGINIGLHPKPLHTSTYVYVQRLVWPAGRLIRPGAWLGGVPMASAAGGQVCLG